MVARMNFPENLLTSDADAAWITRGPDSSGVAGWLLWRDYMFLYEHTGYSSSVDSGIPVSTFLERFRAEDERYRQIFADLAARGYR